jgi:biotin synthase
MAGANSIFYGEKLLTTDNPEADADRKLLARLGMRVEVQDHMHHESHVGAQSSHCHIDITPAD